MSKELHHQVIGTVTKLISLMSIIETLPHEFGTDVKIHASEIHSLDAISRMNEPNMTEAADKLGITKPSLTEVSAKLEKRGLLEKFKLPENRKEVRLRLTKKGRLAVKNHLEFHKEMYEGIEKHMSTVSKSALLEFDKAMQNINIFVADEIKKRQQK